MHRQALQRAPCSEPKTAEPKRVCGALCRHCIGQIMCCHLSKQSCSTQQISFVSVLVRTMAADELNRKVVYAVPTILRRGGQGQHALTLRYNGRRLIHVRGHSFLHCQQQNMHAPTPSLWQDRFETTTLPGRGPDLRMLMLR